jgi:hypothetical protein
VVTRISCWASVISARTVVDTAFQPGSDEPVITWTVLDPFVS